MGADPVILKPTTHDLRKYARPNGIYDFLSRGGACLDLMSWEDDFLGDTINGTYATYANASGTVTLVTSPAAGNGIASINAIGAADGDYCGLYMPNEPCMGQLNSVVAARVTGVTAITDVKFEIGFNDSPAANAGVVNALNTPTYNATDGAVWVFDTNDTAYWQCAAVMAGVGITKLEPTSFGGSNAAPVVGTYQWFIVALSGTTAKFISLDANGRTIYESGWQASAITAATTLSPWIFVQNRTTTAKSLYVDYFGFWQRRTTS